MSSAENPESLVKSDDSLLATCILGLAIFLLISLGIYLWNNRSKLGLTDTQLVFIIFMIYILLLISLYHHRVIKSTFTPPVERQQYIDAKQKLDRNNPTEFDELKKLLMKRAFRTIPLLMSLQNEGQSIERLYKKGILTDDMHNRVKDLKTFVDQEYQDVQIEADDLIEGWKDQIWPEAMRYHVLVKQQAEEKIELQRQAEEEKRRV